MIATLAANRALTDLVETARELELITRGNMGLLDMGQEIAKVINTLDTVRTRLVQEGPSYLDEAWAFVDAGRVVVAGYGIELAKAVGRRARA